MTERNGEGRTVQAIHSIAGRYRAKKSGAHLRSVLAACHRLLWL